jgi:hypothetical protein
MEAVPKLKHFATLNVDVSPAQEIGVSSHGERRIIPIKGGTARGLDWQGKILNGGADYQLIISPRMAHLDAHYVVEVENGERIYVHNRAIRVAEPDVTDKIKKGIPVDPDLIYFRCSPVFETSSSSLQWITERIFIGSGIRRPDLVELQIYEVL